VNIVLFLHPLIVSHCFKKISLAVDTKNELLDKMLSNFQVHFRSIDNLDTRRYAPATVFHQTFNYNSNPLTAMRRAGIHMERELRLQLTTADGLP